MTRTAVVVGGGIGGLGTAAALHRQGWSVRVLEQAAEFTEAGAGISLWPNAFRALAAIGVPAPVRDDRLPAAGGLRDWRGRWLVRLDDSEQVAEHAATAVVAHRAELLSALLDAVPEAVRMPGTRVRSVRLDAGRAVVEYDGGELTADLVVGADGVRSAVRTAVWPEARPPRYSRRTAWRIVLRTPAVLADAGASAWGETWGPGAVFGFWPMPGDRVYCYATGTVPPGERSPDGELAELRRRFGDWCDPIPAVLDAVTPDQVIRNDVYYLPPLRGYVRGPVALVGDAAHAMTPNLAQGGCQALEDAATLAGVLAAEPDPGAALRRYDTLRRPRTQRLASRSRTAGNVGQLSWAPAMAVRNAALRALPRSVFVKALAAPFDWHPEVPGRGHLAARPPRV